MHQRAMVHRILRDPDLHATLARPPTDGSASDHVLNSKSTGLTGYVVEAAQDGSASDHVSNSKKSGLTRYVVEAERWISE